MIETDPKEFGSKRAQVLFSRTKLTPQEVASLAGMSVNTVKKVLYDQSDRSQKAHLNSIVKVQRSLEHYLNSATADSFDEQTLLLSGDASQDVVILAKKLATLMQELVFDPEKAKALDRETLQRVLKSCNGNLSALSA